MQLRTFILTAALAAEPGEAVAKGDGIAAPSGCAFDNDHLAWACERWQREVANRPLRNIHRRTLDDTWRQVIRRLGGDPGILLPMADHDALVAENPAAAVRSSALSQPHPADERVVEALRVDVDKLLQMIDNVQSKPRMESKHGIYHPNSPMAAQVEKVRAALSTTEGR